MGHLNYPRWHMQTSTNLQSTAAAVPEPVRLIRLPETLNIVGLGRSAWLERVKNGTAPAPVKNGRTTAWVESEVRQWVRDRIRESRKEN